MALCMHSLRLESTRSQRHEKDTSNEIDRWGTGPCRRNAHNTAPAMAQDSGYPGDYNYAPSGHLDNLVSRIALYPDPLLAQIFAAAAFPDQIAAAAQGSGGPFDPSVEALMQYPSVLQMMASDPGWTQALGRGRDAGRRLGNGHDPEFAARSAAVWIPAERSADAGGG